MKTFRHTVAGGYIMPLPSNYGNECGSRQVRLDRVYRGTVLIGSHGLRNGNTRRSTKLRELPVMVTKVGIFLSYHIEDGHSLRLKIVFALLDEDQGGPKFA